MNVILLGPPGAGKGTQARLLRDQYGLNLVTTGEILREEVKKATPLGIKVKETIESGGFPSDDIILNIFEEHLKRADAKGVVLDGVPRTLNQAEKIDTLFRDMGLDLDVIIQLAVDDEELIRRLSNRMVCESCGASYTPEIPPRVEGTCDKCGGHKFIRRPDDEPTAIRTRLRIYNEQTKPLIQFYAQTHRLKVVDGMKPVNEVNEQIKSVLEESRVCSKDFKHSGSRPSSAR